MSSLLAVYGEGVARSLRIICVIGFFGALMLAAVGASDGSFVRKCLCVAVFLAVLFALFPSPEFFKALAGRP